MTIELINQYDEKRTVYPLDRDILIPHPFNLNDTLQHLDGQINCAIPYDPEIHKFLVENSFLKSKVYNEESQTIFTGVVKDGLEWIDNGTPEPLNEISLTLQDNGYYLNNTPEEDITYINQSLTTILADICKRCNLQIGSNLPTDTISVAQIKQNTTYLNFINDILFQHCYAFGFDANGVLQTINIKEMETSEVFDDFFTGLKFTKTTKNYNAIHLKYGELTVKQNEQVYYEGGEISSDNTIQPIIIQPNAYYPPEATPIIEEQDGKVIQNFSDGFAQAVTLFNGEKKYQRSKNTELIYTEDHVVTKDYSDNLTLDRTDFTATSASVRFYNNSATDAELYQLAIRATAYYRRPKKLILGEGKKFEYEAIYIYDSQRASTFANFLAKYFLGGNYKIAARTEKNFLPGTKLTLKTGISGIATRAIVISSTYNPREKNYNITFLTESDLALFPKFYQDRHTSQFPGPKGDKGDSGIGIKSITEYYLATDSSSGVTNATSGFTTSMQSLTSEKKYLWNYELITYTDLTTSKTNAVIIGVYGDKGQAGADGEKGDTGKGVKSITEYYLATANASGVTTETSGFTTTIQTVTSSKKYLWNYEKIIYTDNSETQTNAVIIGVYGDKGDTGSKGDTGTRGTLEFSGTEINAISDITEATYTITTASTGITSATMPILVGDTYINITTQDVWICSTAGTPTTAKWKYQGRRCSDKDDSNRFRMFTPATDNGSIQTSLTKQVVKGENPFGKIDDLLKITNTNATSNSNYTPYNRRTKIDPKKTYRHVTYIKQEDANYTDFIGIARWENENSFCLTLSGSTTNSAYFTSASNFGTLGRWYMVVGYIVANGTTTAPADSGVYDMVTKQKVRGVANYQWKPNVTYCTNSGCLIRYTDSASTKTGTAYLYDVRLDEVNGTEPTLNELLNLDTTTKSKGTWTASTIYNTGDIVYLNGNSYICTANHTSGTSFSTTNWNLIASKGADGKDGADGKNAITMTSATTPNGEYNGQIGIWQGQVYQWNGTSWDLTEGVLPTDPVLHYSFDELPDLPDGTSIIAKNRNFVDQDWFVLRGDPALENGCIKITKNVTTDNSYVCFRIKSLDSKSGFNSKVVKIRIFVKASASSVKFRALNYLDSSEFLSVTIATNKWIDIARSLPSENVNNPWIGVMFPTGTEDNYFLVEQMYIGDGSNSSPIIDNAGKNNAKIMAATSVITETGKGFRSFPGKNGYGVAKNPLINPSQVSFSVWLKSYETTATQTIVQSRTIVGSGLSVFIFSEKIRFDFGGVQNTFDFSPSSNRNYHVVVVGTTDKKKLYIDGKLVQSISGDFSVTPNLAENIWFGSSSVNGTSFLGNTLNGELDDFQIFDRPLSDQEVLGLYLARGNTPKQYTRADYEIDLLPETIPQHTPKYLGPVSSESQINALEKKVGDWCLFTGTTTSLYQLGQVYKWNGLVWEIDNDDGHRAQTINDCLALLKQGKEAETYASQFLDLLVSQEVLAEKMSALEVRFQNFVASYQSSELKNGDKYIFMGKNPLKEEEGFKFGINKVAKGPNGDLFYRTIVQASEEESGEGSLVTTGSIKPLGGIDTFGDCYCGMKTEIFARVTGGYRPGLPFCYKPNGVLGCYTRNNTSFCRIDFQEGIQFNVCTNMSVSATNLIGCFHSGNSIYVVFIDKIFKSDGYQEGVQSLGTEVENPYGNIWRIYYEPSLKTTFVCGREATGMYHMDGTVSVTNALHHERQGCLFSNYFVTAPDYVYNLEFYDKNFNLLYFKNLENSTLTKLNGSVVKGVYPGNFSIFNDIFLGVQNGFLIKSEDLGNNWEEVVDLKNPLYSNIQYLNGVYIIACDKSIFYSNDGMKTFNEVFKSTVDYNQDSFPFISSDENEILFCRYLDSSTVQYIVGFSKVKPFSISDSGISYRTDLGGSAVSRTKTSCVDLSEFVSIQRGEVFFSEDFTPSLQREVSIEFSKSFRDTSYTFVATVETTEAGGEVYYYNKTTKGITVGLYCRNKSTIMPKPKISWIAIGPT